jgi:hypothetical protein
MAKKQLIIDHMFRCISKEERFDTIIHDLEVLNSEKEKEQTIGVPKRSVGRPRKEVKMHLLKPKVEKSMKKKKARGTYTNWFCPSLWRPIQYAMKRFRNYLFAMLYLRSAYKEPGESKSIYDGLRRSTLYGWFTTSGVLREKYQHCVQEETYFTKGDQHAPILSKYPEVEEEIISTLKKQRATGQPLYGTTIQPLIKAILRKRVPHLLDFTSKTGFNVSINWTRCFIKRTLN